MPELTVADTTHAAPASTSPRTSLGPDLESTDPSSCEHPLSEQSIDTIDDTQSQYARSCQCGVVLDYWQSKPDMADGLEQLAATRGTTVETIRDELGVDD